jgi:hypothetical protein
MFLLNLVKINWILFDIQNIMEKRYLVMVDPFLYIQNTQTTRNMLYYNEHNIVTNTVSHICCEKS